MWRRGSSHDDGLAERYSVACTRSGLGALVFACVGILTFARAFDFELYRSALEVARLGEQLRIGLDEALASSCWPAGERESIAIAEAYIALCADGQFVTLFTDRERAAYALDGQLPARIAEELAARFNPPDATVTIDSAPAPAQTRAQLIEGVEPTTPEVLTNPDGLVAPSAPTNLTVTTYGVNLGVQTIVAALDTLSDRPEVFAAARAFSNDFDFRLYRWAALKSQLVNNAMIVWYNRGHTGPVEPPDLLLTPEHLRQLVDAYPVRIAEVEASGSGYRIGIPTLAIAASLRDAAFLIMAAMLLLAIYFWANSRLAALRSSFPEPGTLFHVFLSSPVPRVVFFLLLLSPALSGWLLTAKPLDWNPVGVLIASAITVCSGVSLYRIARA